VVQVLVTPPPRVADSEQHPDHHACDDLKLRMLLHPPYRVEVSLVDETPPRVLASVDGVLHLEELIREFLGLRRERPH
jgi:hypothetical protein